MTANGYSLEASSPDIYFRKAFMTGDGILTSLMVMEVLLEKKTALKRPGRRGFHLSAAPEKRPCSGQKSGQRESPGTGGGKGVEEALGENGRILVRESGTEPVIRIMVEAQTDEICRNYVEQVAVVMEEEDLVQ